MTQDQPQTEKETPEAPAEAPPESDAGATSAAADGMSTGQDHKLNMPEPSFKFDPQKRSANTGGAVD